MSYCENLVLGGSTEWRLATIVELESLYDASASDDCTTPWHRANGDTATCHPRLDIDLSGPWVWRATRNDAVSVWSFRFFDGTNERCISNGMIRLEVFHETPRLG